MGSYVESFGLRAFRQTRNPQGTKHQIDRGVVRKNRNELLFVHWGANKEGLIGYDHTNGNESEIEYEMVIVRVANGL